MPTCSRAHYIRSVRYAGGKEFVRSPLKREGKWLIKQDTFTRFAKYDTQTTKPEDPKHTVKTRCESATVHEQQKGHINCHLT